MVDVERDELGMCWSLDWNLCSHPADSEIRESTETPATALAPRLSTSPLLALELAVSNDMSFAKAFSPALREIRILCSQSGPASAGTRSAFKPRLFRVCAYGSILV